MKCQRCKRPIDNPVDHEYCRYAESYEPPEPDYVAPKQQPGIVHEMGGIKPPTTHRYDSKFPRLHLYK